MASKYWIKLYHEILDDPKMGMLPDNVWRRCLEIFLLAGELESDGQLPPTQEIAWRLRQVVEQLQTELEHLEQSGIIERNADGWFICKFTDRQEAVSGAERIKRYRERQRKQEYYGQDSNEPVTKRYTEEEVDKDIEVDKDKEQEVYDVFLNEIGTLSQVIADDIADCITEYSPQWVIDAIKESARANKRSWRYALAILRNWKAKGRDTPRKNNKHNGQVTHPELQPILNDKGEVVGMQ